MVKDSLQPHSIFAAPLAIEELESRLSQLDHGEISSDIFWAENLAAFRDTLLFAINESSELLTGRLAYRLRRELEDQIEALRGYMAIVDGHIAQRGAAARARLN